MRRVIDDEARDDEEQIDAMAEMPEPERERFRWHVDVVRRDAPDMKRHHGGGCEKSQDLDVDEHAPPRAGRTRGMQRQGARMVPRDIMLCRLLVAQMRKRVGLEIFAKTKTRACRRMRVIAPVFYGARVGLAPFA